MEKSEFIERLRQDGALLADAAEEADWGAEVPACPRWRVRDLIRHAGSVHRWAAGFVAGRTSPVRRSPAGPEDDGKLSAWFREGHRRLVDGLAAAPDDLKCWTFMDAPSPLDFWARRQAHETAIHRVDAQAALGKGFSEISEDLALDGVDELLTGFHTRRRSRVRSEAPHTMLVRARDGSAEAESRGEWLIHLSQDPPRVDRTQGVAAECTLTGPPVGLYLALWNRIGFDEAQVRVSGDASLAQLWLRTSGI